MATNPPNTGQVECWMCGELFTPDPAVLSAWAASGQAWEPQDWKCGACDIIVYIEDAHSALGADYENTDWEKDDIEESGWWQSEDMTDE